MNDQIEIFGNDWSTLVPDAEATWTPSRLVSICIPTRDPGPGLERTLRCLSAQTYPAELLEIVIADDGSKGPITVPDGLAHPVRVVRQEPTAGFGAGRARNLAASAARGDILFFLDADVIAERQVVEAYARWFERSNLVAPLGLCRFVDFDGLSDQAVFDLVERGEVSARFEGLDVDDQSWRERHFGRLDDLKIEAVDAFRVTIGATIAVSASQFAEVGGFPELGVRGVEDTAFGYRIHNNGGILVLDRDAMHWHQGRRNVSTERRAEIDRVRAPYVQCVMPVRGFRRGEPPADPPVPVAPVARVHVVGSGADATASRHSVSDDRSGNVALAPEGTSWDEHLTTFDDAHLQVALPAGVEWGEDTLDLILDLLARHHVGVIHAVDDEGAIAHVALTRALRRAVHTAGSDPALDVAARLFGVWWTSADSLDLSGHTTTPIEPGGDSVGAGTPTPRRPRDVALWIYDRCVALVRRAAR